MRHVTAEDPAPDSGEVLVAVGVPELVLLANAINETLEAVDEDEFHARVGATRDEAEALHGKIAAILSSAG